MSETNPTTQAFPVKPKTTTGAGRPQVKKAPPNARNPDQGVTRRTVGLGAVSYCDSLDNLVKSLLQRYSALGVIRIQLITDGGFPLVSGGLANGTFVSQAELERSLLKLKSTTLSTSRHNRLLKRLCLDIKEYPNWDSLPADMQAIAYLSNRQWDLDPRSKSFRSTGPQKKEEVTSSSHACPENDL